VPIVAYVAYIDGGGMIFDIRARAGCVGKRAFVHASAAWPRAVPSTVSGVDPHFQPMSKRRLAWASDEDTADKLQGRTRLVWLLDIGAQTNPVIIGTAPRHADDGVSCKACGRFGAHNLHPNFPGPLDKRLENTTVASWFDGAAEESARHRPDRSRDR
jgi:hypothetical protein